MTVDVQINTGRLNRILRSLAGNRREAVAKLALEVETQAKANIVQQDIVDTGALLNSVYTELPGANNFAAAKAAVESRNPDAVVAQLPAAADDEAHVGPSVEYAIYHEFGTSKMGARPYLGPAVAAAADAAEQHPEWFEGVVTDGDGR